MIRCDKCKAWLHLDCIWDQNNIPGNIYHCPRCVATTYITNWCNSPDPHQKDNIYFTWEEIHETQNDETTSMATELEYNSNELECDFIRYDDDIQHDHDSTKICDICKGCFCIDFIQKLEITSDIYFICFGCLKDLNM